MYIWRSTDPEAVARMIVQVAASRQSATEGAGSNVVPLAPRGGSSAPSRKEERKSAGKH